ncbi:Uncharacterized protein ToN1_39510 [Aromatoleum petrolei]|nr:Uncharacterized protein ToN1_39510 [Aromatoleum petrolei]
MFLHRYLLRLQDAFVMGSADSNAMSGVREMNTTRRTSHAIEGRFRILMKIKQ